MTRRHENNGRAGAKRRKTDARWCEKLCPGDYARIGELTVGKVTISPEAAAHIMAERNTRNRPIVARQLHCLEAEMGASNFFLTGETVIFDTEGTLLNGQHRLQACANSGASFETLIVLGIDPKAFEYLDQGSKRSLGHILAINGETCYSCLAGVLSCFANFLTDGCVTRSKVIYRSHQAYLALLEANPGLRDSANYFHMSPDADRCRLFGGEALPAALHFIFGQVDPEASQAFWDALLTNLFEPTDRWATVRVLFNRLVDNKTSRSEKLPQVVVSAFIIKAWNSFMTGSTPSHLRAPSSREHFPEVHGWTYRKGVPVAAPHWTAPEVEVVESEEVTSG